MKQFPYKLETNICCIPDTMSSDVPSTSCSHLPRAPSTTYPDPHTTPQGHPYATQTALLKTGRTHTWTSCTWQLPATTFGHVPPKGGRHKLIMPVFTSPRMLPACQGDGERTELSGQHLSQVEQGGMSKPSSCRNYRSSKTRSTLLYKFLAFKLMFPH